MIVLAIGLWGIETLPPGVTGMVAIMALVFTRAVPGIREGLAGFADPIAYFLIGVLTMGVGGGAERPRRAGGASVARARARAGPARSTATCCSRCPLLTLLLPSATTRTGILVHVYDQALDARPRAAGRAARARRHDGAELGEPPVVHRYC